MKDFSGMLKQAKEMQSRMAEMQAALQDLEVEGKAGGGLVRVVLSGKGDLKQVHIDKDLVKPDEAEIIEDLIVAAHTSAKAELEMKLQEKMKEVTGGMPLPPGFGL
ncbi:MAG: YbaB/EbfC family nucleoid-associated protein [Fimbriimonadaceae bacterium]|nr:YbaB/EbfC family nucleoid-associated protein [Alphaproteobacteria bacterium]